MKTIQHIHIRQLKNTDNTETHARKERRGKKGKMADDTLTTGAFPFSQMTDQWTLKNLPLLEARHHGDVASSTPTHSCCASGMLPQERKESCHLARLSSLQPLQEEETHKGQTNLYNDFKEFIFFFKKKKILQKNLGVNNNYKKKILLYQAFLSNLTSPPPKRQHKTISNYPSANNRGN